MLDPQIKVLSCPECGSGRIVRDGLRYSSDVSVQRFRCKDCDHRFSDPKGSRECLAYSSIGEYAIGESKNLLQAIVLMENGKMVKDSGATTLTENVNAMVVDFAWQMKKRRLTEVTIQHRIKYLNVLLKMGADLTKPDSVETVLATEELTPAKEYSLVSAYRAFTKAFGISWTPIKTRYEPKQPFIPKETEIDQLIAGCGKRTATFLQVLKDTGARAGEASQLKWTDVDQEKKTISINNPEKRSRSRAIKVSDKTIAMINAMPRKYGDYIFNHKRLASIEDAFRTQRNRLAATLQHPRLKLIHFHTLRHWRATEEYRKTNGNLVQVQYLLGHKSIANTGIYTHLVDFGNEEFYSAVARTIDEERKLIDEGWQFVHEKDGVSLYRKRKC
jgi:integrase